MVSHAQIYRIVISQIATKHAISYVYTVYINIQCIYIDIDIFSEILNDIGIPIPYHDITSPFSRGRVLE